MVKVRRKTVVGWAMKGGSIMKTGRNIAVLAVSLLAVLVLVLLWIGRGGREPEKTEVSVTEKQAMTFAEGEIRRIAGEGGPVYMTQDIGTAKLRFADYPIDKMIYVVGNEQNYHFQVLSILLDKLGFEWGKGLVHFSYGMVELPEGKMKSREGTVVDADDLMAEMIETAKETSNELGKLDGLTKEEADNIARIVGLGALKYFILKVDARKNMTFNPKESIDFNGNTGPFIQYTYARIQSVLRKAKEAGIVIPAQIPANIELSEKEEGLIQMVADFAAVVKQAGEDYSPSVIANYTYDLVKEYNQFYHDFSILREENEAVKVFRLALSENVAKVVRLGMGLLGIEVPDRM